jgi:hypothetical protein
LRNHHQRHQRGYSHPESMPRRARRLHYWRRGPP